MTYQPVVIVGAPRSGTNMLRDVLCQLPGVATWPCDEINYIWRHGNVRYPSDELPAERVSPTIREYIRKHFNWVASHYSATTVIEKTCANSLRVPFVDRVLPEAKYIYIHRDGIDATGSATLRWTAELDLPYIMQKVRFVPVMDLPYYGVRYIWSRLYRLFSRERRLAFWGPALDGMSEILENYSLHEVCALQWQRCVESAESAFSDIDEERVHRVSYESLVKDPIGELSKLLKFLNIEASPSDISQSVAGVSSSSIGKGRASLSEAEIIRLKTLIEPTLARYGY
ncbi:sulfotransferase family protein [Kineobactrum salinum]|uniref:Sulfotransferase n=1 Tax=Kineobactrum salinum TaxID=2708301 RepID=A0A6C0U6C3_9GAMM|nr:sulfotransferase [Kineobactrum salinum]QIB65975.1 sulfotransferase [Kineobactrum salinum]